MPRESINSLEQLNSWKSFEYPFLWLSAAGIAVTMIWLPLINAMMCICFLLLWLYYRRLHFEFSFLLVLWISVYLITAVSFFYSENRSEALRILQLKLPLLVFPLIFASGINWKKEQIRLLLLLFSWSVGIFCVFTIGNALLLAFSSGNIQSLFGYKIIPFKFVYASVISLFCVFGTVIQLYDLSRKKQIRTEHLFLLLLFWITLILLSNRMGLLLSSIITIYFLFGMVRSVIMKGAVAAILFTVFISLYNWNNTFREKIQVITNLNSSQMIQLDENASLDRTWDGLQLRWAIWNCAAGAIKKHFWIGTGVGDAQQTLQQTYEQRKFYFASKYNTYNAHNQFLEQWLMTGIAGFLAFFLYLAISLIQSIRNRRVFYTLFLVVFTAFCFTESVLEVSKGVVWFSFFNSIFAFSDRGE